MAPTEMERREVKSERFDDGGIHGEEGVSGFGSVKFTRGLGRKRVVISSGCDRELLERRHFGGEIDRDSDQSSGEAPLKRQRSGVVDVMVPSSDKSLLESLPRDLLIRLLCGVDHEDLQRLFLVSKLIKEAASIAKRSHFAFTTPKKTPAFRNPIDLCEVSCDLDDGIDPPNAPIQRKTHRESTTKRKDLSSVSMALFT